MTRFSFIYLVIVLMILCFSCKKEQTDTPTNYNPIGKYKVVQHIYSTGTWPDTNSYIDTFIGVTKGNTDSTFFLLGYNVLLNEAGKYRCGHFFSCRLWNDSLETWELVTLDSGLTGALFRGYKGIRISKIP